MFGRFPNPTAAAFGHPSPTRPAPIGRYRHGNDRVRMAFERAQCLAALQVPQPQRSVTRSRDGTASVGRYRHGIDPARMAFERAQCLAALQVPDPQRSVIRAETARRPSGVTATALTCPYGLRACDVWPLSKSQSRSVRSSEADTARRPSGVTATALTQSVWPSSVRRVWPLSRSQSRSVRSLEPDTARRPSGVTATALTASVWPSSVRSVWPLSRSQSRSVRSSEPETARRPSGVTATALTVRMAFERAQCLAALQVPEPQRSVLQARDGTAPIGRYRHGTDPADGLERAQCLAALQVPQPQRTVIEPETARRPSGVTATAVTLSVWPSSVRIGAGTLAICSFWKPSAEPSMGPAIAFEVENWVQVPQSR